ncbi:MAG: hypothetical protein IK005_13385 [Paludibacteraceae bacterium]|nr:hypothetical protein [Paludibacteraceae bacterium]
MKNFFLKIKHWQLFLLLCVPCLLFFYRELADFHWILSDLLAELLFGWLFTGWPLIMPLFASLVWWAYAYALMWAFDERMPLPLKEDRRFEHFCLSLPFFFVVTMMVFPAFCMNLFLFQTNIGHAFASLLALLMSLVVFFWTLGGILLLLGIYLLAKAMRVAELQREVKVKEVLGDFFLFLFFPLGVWFLQPRVNRMYEKDKEGFVETNV